MYRILKRISDILISGLLLIILLPVFLLLTLLIYLTSGFPVLFQSVRIGKDGRQIIIYKFRTMINIDERQYLKNLISGNLGPKRGNIKAKMENDPRITNVGRFLRKYGLDEIPQLVSILKGEMSLVGPRPRLLYEVYHFSERQKVILTVKPGLTGLSQMARGGYNNFEDLINLDIEYIKKRSIFIDLKILIKTVLKTISGRAAY